MDFNNLIGGVNNALMSPAALAGLGLLSGEGMSGAAQGVQAGTQALQARELQRQAAIKAQRDQDWQNTFANGQTPDWAKGLPPSLVHTAAIMGPDQGSSLIGQGILRKGDLDASMKQAQAMADLEFRNQLRVLKAQQDLKMQNFGRFLGVIPGGAAPVAQSGPQPTAPTIPMSPAPPIAAGPATDATGGGMNVPNLFSGPPTIPPQSAAPQGQPPSVAPQGSMLPGQAPMDPRMVGAGVAAGLIDPAAAKYFTEGDEQSKVRSRAMTAQQMGMDPNDPMTKSYVLTGQYPRAEKNWPAIQKADQGVLDAQNSLDVIDEASKVNPNAYSGFAPETRAWLGSMIGLQGAKDTMQYQADAKLLSQEYAKALGGARPTAFEQKLMSDLQGGLSQPPDVRAKILQRARHAVQNRLNLAQKQADELRNGTYYRPGNAESTPSRTFNWDPNSGLTEAPQQ